MNYVQVHRFSLLYKYYIFADAKKGIAGGVFNRRGVHAKCVGVFTKKDVGFDIVYCRIRNRDVEAFRDCMEEVNRNMLVLYGEPYTKFVEYLSDMMFRRRLT